MAANDEWEDVDVDSEWEDVPDEQSEFDDFKVPSLAVAEEYVGPVRKAGQAVLGAIGTAGEFIDRFTGAPVRAGIGKALDYDPIKSMQSPQTSSLGSEFIKGYAGQFGRPSEKAPSGKDILARAGVPTTEYSTGLILDPYKAKTLKVSPAGVGGAVLETVADPVAAFFPA